MRYILPIILAALVLMPSAQAADRPESFADLAQKLSPAVVNISSTQKISTDMPQDMPDMPQFPEGSPLQEFFQEYMDKGGSEMFPSVPQASLGSGFIIDGDKGLIITNNHVIRDADKVRVTMHDDTTLEAKVIGTDEKTDLAVLQIKTKKPLPSVTFGNSDKMRVGDWILAIGNPFGLGGTVTSGIISARQRDINAGPYDDFIQTDASINRGNSGGPMFNLDGEVIGINTAIFSPSGGSVGIGFAIPSNLAKPVLDQIIKFGRTRRGWIGVRIQAVTEEIAQSLGLPRNEGALVASVTPKSPAAKAGLAAGDVILTFNGQSINAMRHLPRLVAESEIGQTVKVTYWRAGKTLTTKMQVLELETETATKDQKPADAPAAPSRGKAVPEIGLRLGTLGPMERRNFGIPEATKGILVMDVNPASEAAEKGLAVGDVILEVNQQKLATPDAMIDMIAKAKKGGKSSILLLLDMGGKGDVRFVALRLK
ncbi:MAG: DegQ family serine endoprotease [Pseudomonadota bacterium]